MRGAPSATYERDGNGEGPATRISAATFLVGLLAVLPCSSAQCTSDVSSVGSVTCNLPVLRADCPLLGVISGFQFWWWYFDPCPKTAIIGKENLAHNNLFRYNQSATGRLPSLFFMLPSDPVFYINLYVAVYVGGEWPCVWRFCHNNSTFPTCRLISVPSPCPLPTKQPAASPSTNPIAMPTTTASTHGVRSTKPAAPSTQPSPEATASKDPNVPSSSPTKLPSSSAESSTLHSVFTRLQYTSTEAASIRTSVGVTGANAGGLEEHWIIVIGVASGFGLVLIAVSILVCVRKHRRNRHDDVTETGDGGGDDASVPYSVRVSDPGHNATSATLAESRTDPSQYSGSVCTQERNERVSRLSPGVKTTEVQPLPSDKQFAASETPGAMDDSRGADKFSTFPAKCTAGMGVVLEDASCSVRRTPRYDSTAV